MNRRRLGAWQCASGNGVDVYFVRNPDGLGLIAFEWDAPPPLSRADQVEYEQTILPAVVQRMQEYLEVVGPALVVLA